MGEAAPSRSWRQRVGGAVTDRRLVAYVLMPLLLACAFTLLIALNVLLRNLWGELVYAILVTGIALWALSQTTLVMGSSCASESAPSRFGGRSCGRRSCWLRCRSRGIGGGLGS